MNDHRIRAHDHVVANRDRAHDFAACAEIHVIPDRCAANSADIHDTCTLVESATVANLLGQDENAAEVMDDKTGPNLVFARDMDPRDRHAKDVNEQVEGDEDLADNRNLYGIGPGTESINDNGKGPEFEERCNALAKECLVFRTDTEASHFPSEIGTNEFKHMIELIFELFEVSEGLQPLFDFGRLFVGVAAGAIVF